MRQNWRAGLVTRDYVVARGLRRAWLSIGNGAFRELKQTGKIDAVTRLEANAW
jgi:hypothetical protein